MFPKLWNIFWFTEQLCAIHEQLCYTLGNNRLEGSWDRSVIVAAGLWAEWPRNCGSYSGRGTNFCGLCSIHIASEIPPASCSWSSWGEVAAARRQPLLSVWCQDECVDPYLHLPLYGFIAWCLIKHKDGLSPYGTLTL